MDQNEKRITRIFGVTKRGKFHIMRRANKVYCKGTAADVVRVMHLDGLPASSVCKHCVKAYREDYYNNKILMHKAELTDLQYDVVRLSYMELWLKAHL